MRLINEDKYNEFISLLELRKINLESLRCEKNKDFSRASVSIDVALDYEVDEAQQKDLQIMVPFKFRVKAFANETNEEKDIDAIEALDTLFNIEMKLLLIYYLDIDEVDTKEVVQDYSDVLEAFAERNVTINAWPYVRETVQSLTNKMGLPSLVIPLKKSRFL